MSKKLNSILLKRLFDQLLKSEQLAQDHLGMMSRQNLDWQRNGLFKKLSKGSHVFDHIDRIRWF